MFYHIICLSVLVLFSTAANYKECADCKYIKNCTPALQMVERLSHRNDTMSLLKSAACDVVPMGEKLTLKVCCSDFNKELDEIEGHRNRYLLPEYCGKINGMRIIGSTSAKLHEFPWMALIFLKKNKNPVPLCGGSIINKNYILTAAHCLKGNEMAGVRIGEYDLSKPVDCNGIDDFLNCNSYYQDMAVHEVIYHGGYESDRITVNDIALLRLKIPINFDLKNVTSYPICLPVEKELRVNDITGKDATIAGWGSVTANHERNDVLQKTNIIVNSFDTCKTYYRDHKELNLCAGLSNRDSCRGDSGGPLIIESNYDNVDKYVQFGIISAGDIMCGSGKPGLYTDVRKYMKWILDIIKP